MQAINKLQEKIEAKQTAKKFESLFHNLNANNISKKICVPVLNGFILLQVDEIMYCESSSNYTTLFLKDKRKLLVAKTLKEFEELLHDYNFYRIHNSHLVNLTCIKNYNKGKGGFVTMEDGSAIEVSTRRKDEFLKKLTAL